MSVKAKLEAVIYAADEPITLAQLAALFADEALAWRSERDAARAAQIEENEYSVEAAAESLLLLEGEDLSPGSAAAPAPAPVLEAEQGAEILLEAALGGNRSSRLAPRLLNRRRRAMLRQPAHRKMMLGRALKRRPAAWRASATAM